MSSLLTIAPLRFTMSKRVLMFVLAVVCLVAPIGAQSAKQKPGKPAAAAPAPAASPAVAGPKVAAIALGALEPREIGPATMSGRVSDIALIRRRDPPSTSRSARAA